eukprot:9019570-Pyramimonas_sp.AAC.2
MLTWVRLSNRRLVSGIITPLGHVRPPVAVYGRHPRAGHHPAAGVPAGGEVPGVEAALVLRRLAQAEAVVAPPAAGEQIPRHRVAVHHGGGV